jgi:hypothetical protein
MMKSSLPRMLSVARSCIPRTESKFLWNAVTNNLSLKLECSDAHKSKLMMSFALEFPKAIIPRHVPLPFTPKLLSAKTLI